MKTNTVNRELNTVAPAGHTPSPWHIGMNPGPIIYGPKGESVADMTCDFLPRDERTANLRLVTAAPDLLAALERAAAQFDCTVAALAQGQTVSISSLQNCAAHARAAISQAINQA